MPKVTIEEREARPVLGIRAPVRLDQIGETIGRLMPALMQAVAGRAAGPVIARYHDWKDAAGTLELAVPVSGPLPGTGDVQPGALPACRVAVVEHVGPYDGLAAAWHAMDEWMQAEGHVRGGAAWEEYVSDCDATPPAELVTRIVWPLA